MSHAKMNMLKSIGYLLISVFMFSVVTYAWFTITDTNQAHLAVKTSGVEAEYKFYVYKNIYHSGSSNLTLIDNICTVGLDEDLCYEEVNNPITPKLIEGSVAPGERFSFAIAIQSLGSTQGYVDLSFGNLESIGYDLEENKIQTAFGYEVTKISYIDENIETNDVKDLYLYQSYTNFSHLDDVIYPLVTDVSLVYQDQYAGSLIIYFDVYYDPTIFGVDPFGMPYTNSHIFMNQTFNLHDVYMNVTTQKGAS